MRRIALVILAALLVRTSVLMANAPVPMALEAYHLDLGTHDNTGDRFIVVPPVVVTRPGVHWMRVHFSEVELGAASYVVLSSVLDGQEQILDAPTLAAWSYGSAAFHGDSVQVELHVAPGDKGVHLSVLNLTIPILEPGGEVPEARSICGANDDRVASSDSRVGRLPATGCTGWLVSNGAVLTAGHCGVAVGDLLEFNVPASSANGVTDASNANDQYPITAIAAIANGGIGNDYQVLRLGPNTANGDRAHVSRGFFRMVQTTPTLGNAIRVTGYGLDNVPAGTGGAGAACCDPDGTGSLPCGFDCNSSSQTEQTTTGAFVSFTGGNTHNHSVDTMPANSGSPMIWEAFGVTIGIHTNGGCTSSGGSNSGTAFAATPLRNALQAFPGSNAVFLDSGVSGLPQNGGIYEPYINLSQASAGVVSGGIISMVAGTYPAAAGNAITLGSGFKAMTLEAPVGAVTIGN